MNIGDLEDFYSTYIKMVEAVTSSENKLTERERNFLIECCMFNQRGGDLGDFQELSGYLIDKRFFKRKQEVSDYKYRLSTKKWVISNHMKFEIPGLLGEKDLRKLKINIGVQYTGPLEIEQFGEEGQESIVVPDGQDIEQDTERTGEGVQGPGGREATD